MTDRNGGDRDRSPGDPDFEEFKLDEGQPWERREQEEDPYGEPYDPYAENIATVSCPSCAAVQLSANRHCEECGAQLLHFGRPPVAPPPLPGVTAGSRALAAIAVVLAVVVGGALIWLAIRGDDAPPEAGSEDTSTTSSLVEDSPPVEEIIPADIVCSSEYDNDRLRCENLIDGDTSTYWNDNSLRGDGAMFTVTFPSAVQLTQIQFWNVPDDLTFRRNYRINGVEIIPNDSPGVQFVENLNNENAGPLVVSTPTTETTQLVIRVASSHPSEDVGGNAAFDELALAEIRFWGRQYRPSSTRTTVADDS